MKISLTNRGDLLLLQYESNLSTRMGQRWILSHGQSGLLYRGRLPIFWSRAYSNYWKVVFILNCFILTQLEKYSHLMVIWRSSKKAFSHFKYYEPKQKNDTLYVISYLTCNFIPGLHPVIKGAFENATVMSSSTLQVLGSFVSKGGFLSRLFYLGSNFVGGSNP